MKLNKLLLIALPILLATVGCDNSGSRKNPESDPTSNTSESQSESQPGPSGRSEEEELPEKTPEELEEEALTAFNRLSNLIVNGNYFVEVQSSYTVTPYHSRTIITEDIFLTYTLVNGTYYSDSDYVFAIENGYLANKDGVLRLRARYAQSHSSSEPVGFALKTTYEEAKQFIASKQVRIPFNIADWQFISNTNGTASFKTTNAEVIKKYNLYETGSENTYDYKEIYASIDVTDNILYLSAEGFGDTASQLMVKDLNLEGGRSLTRDSDPSGDEYYERRYVKGLLQFVNYDFSSTDWDTTFDYLINRELVPFPSNGDKYYFIDKIDYNSWNNTNKNKIGFFNTGDITANYASQLLSSGFENVPGATNQFKLADDYSNYTITLSYEAASTNYPQGIFYITMME